MSSVGWRRLALLAAGALGACDGSMTGPSVRLDTTVAMAPGETASIAATATRLHFIGVAGDSRCPADALCITGGDAAVRIAITTGGTRRDYELHTGSMAPVRDAGLTIALVELSPYPFSTRPIAPDEYRVTLRVTR